MASLAEYLEVVDNFMQSDKILVGADQPIWAPGRDGTTVTLKLPVEVGGEQKGPKFIIDVDMQLPWMSFAMCLVVGYCVCRLDYGNEASHSNGVAASKEGLLSVIQGNHYHPWSLNKRFVEAPSKPFGLERAVPFTADARQFDAILRWFCGENKIFLPHDHRIALPPRDTLFV